MKSDTPRRGVYHDSATTTLATSTIPFTTIQTRSRVGVTSGVILGVILGVPSTKVGVNNMRGVILGVTHTQEGMIRGVGLTLGSTQRGKPLNTNRD
jgi:hypothetical protein